MKTKIYLFDLTDLDVIFIGYANIADQAAMQAEMSSRIYNNWEDMNQSFRNPDFLKKLDEKMANNAIFIATDGHLYQMKTAITDALNQG